MTEPAKRPDVVEEPENAVPAEVAPPAEPDTEADVLQPTKLIRIASMTRALLEEARHAPLDEPGRKRLGEIHDLSLDELREVLSNDLQAEFNEIFRPLHSEVTPSESELRLAQAQLIGWLEGLFHGIQASLWSQQMAAQAQLAELQRRQLGKPQEGERTGLYL